MGMVGPDGQEVPMDVRYNVEVNIRKRGGKVKIDNIPPEELIFSRRATSLEDCGFIAHRTQVRAGDLIEQGYDENTVLAYAGYDDLDDEAERQARFEDLESGDRFESFDPTMREVLVTEASYWSADFLSDV